MSPEQGLLVTEFVSEQDGGSMMAGSLVIANSCFLYKQLLIPSYTHSSMRGL